VTFLASGLVSRRDSVLGNKVDDRAITRYRGITRWSINSGRSHQ